MRAAPASADSLSPDFMFGLRSEYQLTTFFIANYRQAMHFAYVQDDLEDQLEAHPQSGPAL